MSAGSGSLAPLGFGFQWCPAPQYHVLGRVGSSNGWIDGWMNR